VHQKLSPHLYHKEEKGRRFRVSGTWLKKFEKKTVVLRENKWGELWCCKEEGRKKGKGERFVWVI